MTTKNNFFNHHSNTEEQSLVASLVEESIQIVGFDGYYLPRFAENVDPLTQDAEKISFDSAHLLEMYFDSPEDGFGDSVDYISNFGFEVRDSADFVFSVKRFQELKIPNRNEDSVQGVYPVLEAPLEGDLIYLPFTNSILEVKFVEDWAPFFQLGSNYIFKAMCRLLIFNNQIFSDDLKLYGDDYTEITELTSEQIDALSMITSIDETWNKTITLDLPDGSGTETIQTSENPFDQSDIFQLEDLIDMSEDNPFGEF